MISPEMVHDFFSSFAIEEYKYKLLFAVQITTGLRIGEVLPINILDFLYQEKYANLKPEDLMTKRTDYLWLHNFMTDLFTERFDKFKVLLEKKKTENVIVDMNLPISVSSLLKEYVLKNLHWIMRKHGFIFCKNNNRLPLHLSYHHAAIFLHKKRQQLHKLYPEAGFMDVVSTVNYEQEHGFGKTKTQKLYCFSTHSFRKFHALYGYKFAGKDPIFARQLLHHAKQSTTEKHYLSHYDFEAQRINYQEKTFDANFHELLRNKESKAVAVWEKIKKFDQESS